MGFRDAARRYVDAVPLRKSGVAGAGAFATGYVLTGVAVLLDSLLAGGSESENTAAMVAQWPQFVGTLFYDAHYVDLQFDVPEAVGTTSVLSELDLVFPAGVYYALPVVALGLAGFTLVWRATDDLRSRRDAAVRGASVVVAYLPLVVACATFVAVDVTVSGYEITLSPNLRLAVARAGFFYPLVVGALGGVGAFLLAGDGEVPGPGQ